MHENHAAVFLRPALVCDGEVGEGSASLTGGGVYTKTKHGIVENHESWFLFAWETPAFRPELPIIVALYSRTAIRALTIEEVPYTWP